MTLKGVLIDNIDRALSPTNRDEAGRCLGQAREIIAIKSGGFIDYA
jgi:hypothetical protein